MKARIFLLLFVVCTAVAAQDINIDPLKVRYSSDFEKQVFNDLFINKKTDLFGLFIANGTLLSENSIAKNRSRFLQELESLKTDKIASRKNEKKVRYVYDYIHKTFLTKYEINNKFEDIFANGFYNCVSASALYALVFSELNMPFVIKEKPTHVYLIAYPDAEKITVESTNPLGGSYVPEPQFKQTFVKVLKDQKLISAQEYASRDVDELFDEHYYGSDQNISLLQLAGIQYMNAALYLIDEKNFSRAAEELEKAYLLYPSERIGYLLMMTTHKSFLEHERKDTVHAQLLSKLARFNKYGITNDMIQGEFNLVIQHLLFDKGQKADLRNYYEQLLQLTPGEDQKHELAFLYNYEYGRYHYNQGQFRASLPHFEDCMKIKPAHQETQQILISALAKSLENTANDERIRGLEDFSARYPGLLGNHVFRQMLGTAYLIETMASFESARATDGERYKTAFEAFRMENKDVIYNAHLVGNAYSAAAVYYFRKGQTARARSILALGLEISPDNYELLRRQRMIN